MTLGIGYFIGFIVLVLYGIMCISIGITHKGAIWKVTMTKMKMFGIKTEEATIKFCKVFGALAIVIAIIVLVLGIINAQ